VCYVGKYCYLQRNNCPGFFSAILFFRISDAINSSEVRIWNSVLWSIVPLSAFAVYLWAVGSVIVCACLFIGKSVSECRDHKIKHIYSVLYIHNSVYTQLDYWISIQTGFYTLSTNRRFIDLFLYLINAQQK